MDMTETVAAPGWADLSIPRDVVCTLVALAHDLQGKSESTLDEGDSGDSDDMPGSILEDRGDDPAEFEFDTLVADLPEDAQIELVALMWLGREGEASNWTELRALAEQEHSGTTAAYLRGTPLMADYLDEGLSALGLDCSDLGSDTG